MNRMLLSGSEQSELNRRSSSTLIEQVIYHLVLISPAVFGILTIFGRKKNEKPEETKQVNVSSSERSTNSSQEPAQIPVTPVRDEKSIPPPPSQASYQAEETSLNKLLQSLMQDLPTSSFGAGTPVGSDVPATPDYVPLRATPPSRAMVIDSKGLTKELEDDDNDKDTLASTKPSTPLTSIKPEEVPTSASKPLPVPASIPIKSQEVTEKQSKPEKPDKPEKLTKQPTQKKEVPGRQGFDHIFQLTQGSLETPGLVIINGSQGSGKTTVCSALSDNYEKVGNPCLYVTYDHSPADLRAQMKKLGGDPTPYESQFRFMLIDGFSSQTESFSMEPYYVEQPFDFENIQDVITRNSQVFSGDKIRVFFDSLDKVATKVPQKVFAKKFGELASKMREMGTTLIVTVDLSKLPKETSSALEDAADCIIDILRDGSNGESRDMKVRKLNKSYSKVESETFQVDSGKGLVFV